MRFSQLFSPKPSIHDIDTLCQQYLTLIYANAPNDTHIQSLNISETYGEILYQSINSLIRTISLTEQDIFVDLGSGKGQIVLQFFLKTNVKAAFGIEILPHLHAKALAAKARILADLPDCFHNSRTLNFLSGSFLEIPFNNATIALLTSTCFTQSLLNELGRKIDETHSIHTVLTLRPISTLRRLTFKKVIRVECSWDSALRYIYTLKASSPTSPVRTRTTCSSE